ncbi:PLP-dependent aminotransferase family protein (plasmid) [Sinorhizobium medicae]|uniref:aminotransferase-like domain-containing protein n=1 Tax=Sinorhizobium medicae TaxID=110321 RepID=UPI002AF6C057|nr:PLP-dependent aminotransferase family protein [Sinorhizobium medicae]WQO62271.1 PLP-dependent aminotransferase family protein [Sinorhizobium medicae]
MNTHKQPRVIDLTRTMAPEVPSFSSFIKTELNNLAAEPDLANLIQRHRFHGTDHDKTCAVKWLATRLVETVDPDRLLVTGGTQNILLILLPYLARQRGAIATERLTYAAIGQLANISGLEVRAVDLDEEGMMPAALEAVCRAGDVGAIYINPTGHNPTTAIMSPTRREAIASVARKYHMPIVEDDVHGFITKNAPPPMATFAPELTWYVMSLSKCIGIGLRTAYLVGPSPDTVKALTVSIPSVSAWFVPGLSAALVSKLIETGAAERISSEIADEIEARQQIATEILGPLGLMRSNPSSLHLWIDLPSQMTVDHMVSAAAARNVLVRHPKVFSSVGNDVDGNIRLSVIAPKSHDELREGLHIVREVIERKVTD